MNQFPKLILSTVLVIATMIVPATATAQEQDEAAAAQEQEEAAATAQEQEQEVRKLEEIIVTAKKRSETAQNVAVALSALSERTLDSLGVSNFEDMARSIATMNYTSDGPNKQKIIVRGLSEGPPEAQDYQIQSSVAIYIDETAVTTAWVKPDLHIIDLARVELLRGPQGTLYGSGSMGGTLKMVTNKPNLDRFGGKVDATYSTMTEGENNHELGLVLNVPLGDKNALRVAAFTKKDGGFIDNTALGLEDWNTIDTTGVRLAWRLQPTENLNMITTYTHQNTDVEGRNRYEPELGDLQFYGPIPEVQEDTVDMFNFDLNYDGWNFANLVSATSYYEGVNDWVFDWTAVGYSAAEALFVFSGTEPIVWQNIDNEFSVFAQEVRLVSKGSGPFTWTTGLFYSTEETFYTQWVWADQLERLMSITPLGAASVQPGGVAYLGEDAIFYQEAVHEVDQFALYGEVSYDFTDKWRGTVGARWFNVDMSNNPWSVGAQNMITPAGPNAAAQRLIAAGIEPTPEAVMLEVLSTQGLVGGEPMSDTDDGINPKFALEFRPSDKVLTYGLASKGYRNGGVNSGLSVSFGAPQTYGPDSLWNYELGVKSTLAGGRATLNGAVYYLDWSDIISVGGVSGFRYRINGGKASVVGAELDTAMVITKNWSFNFGINYADSQLDENICNDFISETPCTDDSPDLVGREGDQLIGAPKLSYTAALQYDGRLSNTLDWRALLDFKHVGPSGNWYETNAYRRELGDYDVVNLRFSVLASQGWEVTLFGKNLTDERGRTSTQYVQGNYDPSREYLRWMVIRPLTIGANVRFYF